MIELIKTKKEKSKYALLYQITSSTNAEILSNGNSFYMARSDKEYPVWIWSKNNINKSSLNELKSALEKFLITGKTVKCTCSKELYERLKKDNFKYLKNDYFEMGTYFCKKLKKPLTAKGGFRLATKNDVSILAKYHKDDRLEIDKEEISLEQSKKDIQDVFNSNNKTFYVWEDDNKKVVCMAVINRTSPFARINYVYTPKEERCKGYAKNLIYSLTKIVLDEGVLTPVLYTDYNYYASNKAYKDVGYEFCGILINFSCLK